MKSIECKKYAGSGKTVVGICVALLVLCTGCSKMITAKRSPTEITGELVFDNDMTAAAAVNGIYSLMSSGSTFANGDITIFSGLSADEFINYSPLGDQPEFYSNNILAANSTVSKMWGQMYNVIYQANAIIQGLEQSSGVSENMKKRLNGEAKCIRAFCYFYLINLWSDVPLIIGTDYQSNALAFRTPVQEIYTFIEVELSSCKAALLGDMEMDGSKTRVNQYAAAALLARVYLFEKKWDDAVNESSFVINSGNYSLCADLNTVFLKNSTEAIWQLAPVENGINTREGNYFILTGDPQTVTLRESFVQEFATNDNRKNSWIGDYNESGPDYYFPYKYKVSADENVSEYTMIFRLAELYLIRAEARSYSSDLSVIAEGVQDLNNIRSRAGLASLTGITGIQLRSAVNTENQFEFFAEWGHRWLDLKRTDRADAVLSVVKNSWQETDVFYPIPVTEIQNDPNLTQNKGY